MQNAFVPQKQHQSCPLGASSSPAFDSIPGGASLPHEDNGHVESPNGAAVGRGAAGSQTGSPLSPPDKVSMVGRACTGSLVSVTAHPRLPGRRS